MDVPTALERLNLPATFLPVATEVSFAKVGAAGPDGTKTLHVMLIDTPIGRLAFAFDDVGFRTIGEAIVGQAAGLSIASTVPPSNGRNGHK